MRHRKRRTRFNRTDAHRKATLAMIAKSLFIHQSIKTTIVKAKEARRVAENLITLAKKNDVSARRRVFSVLRDRGVTQRLFKEITPLFANRIGGYTRIIPLKYRRGDGAKLVILELTEKIKESQPKKKPILPRQGLEEKTPKKELAKKAKPMPEIPKAAPQVKPEVKEQKVTEDVKKEKSKKEEKKIEKKRFFTRFFRRRTNM